MKKFVLTFVLLLILCSVLVSLPEINVAGAEPKTIVVPDDYNKIGWAIGENFTIVVLPDTQGYSKNYPWIFDNQTQWIVDNKEALNIVFVTHLGDLVDRCYNTTEWENANRSMSKLDENVPWGVLPGNHDEFSGNLANYNKYFGYDRFSDKSWYGGAYKTGDNANSYQLFSAGGDDYLIFHLQYDPSDDVLFWASNVISQYPDRKIIVSTHDYMLGWEKIGQRSDIGERIWHSLIKPNADQIFLVLCGHSGSEDMITDTVNGHVVYQLLADYQNRTTIESGWLRILKFCPKSDKIYVKTYSPYLNKYKNNSQSEFTLDYKVINGTRVIPESPVAEGTIYIRSDGSVEPSTAPIQRDGNVYTFTENIYGSIVVERDNVVIDGAGFALQGTGANNEGSSTQTYFNLTQIPFNRTSGLSKSDKYTTPESDNTGIYSYAEKLTIKNLKITEFWCAIELEYSSDNCIIGNNIMNNTSGVWIHYSSNNTIARNDMMNNERGISLMTSYNNVFENNITNNREYGIQLVWSFNNVSGNSITKNGYGIWLDHSSHNTFRDNVFHENNYGFYVSGSSLPEFLQDIDDSNVVDGKPVYYWVNKRDMIVPFDAEWVALINCTRITVQNLNLTNKWQAAVLLVSTANSTITQNHITNSDQGIGLYGSSNSNISGNIITDSGDGIAISQSSNDNVLSGNYITNNSRGIYLSESTHNMLRNNSMIDNKQNLFVSSPGPGYAPFYELSHFVHDVDTSNTVNGKPIYYWINKRDKTVPSDAGYVALINCVNIEVENLNLTNGQGIMLVWTTNSSITKNTITNSNFCILLANSSNNIITGNTLTSSDYGIRLGYSSDNHVVGNRITNNRAGVSLDFSSKNNIDRNDITKNDWYGIGLFGSSHNIVSGNNVAENVAGIHLDTIFTVGGISDPDITANWGAVRDYESSNNSISENNILKNTYGVRIYSSSSNSTIYHNNFVNNTNQTYTGNSVNFWDNDVEGNYWSDYEDRYPNATELDDSGIWDTPYVIDENNQDRYPLVNPVVIPEFPDTTPHTSESFPTTWIVAAIAIIAVVGAALLVYFAKVKKTTGKVE